MTSIAENSANCDRPIARPTFDAAQERSREIKGNQGRINLRKLTSEYVSQLQNQKVYVYDITHLNIRELVEMEMQRLLSDPEELTGKFREESDHDTAIKLQVMHNNPIARPDPLPYRLRVRREHAKILFNSCETSW